MTVPPKIIPLFFLILGLVLLFQVSLPMAVYKFWELKSENATLVSPFGSQVSGISISSQDNFPIFVSNLKRSTPAPYQQFKISIEKLSIKEAMVTVDSNDLDKGLVLLPGTALPGERGNVFISGHSSVLFKNNFSRLQELHSGDQIKLNVGGTDLNYQVVSSKAVDPKDLSVIASPDGVGRYLSLMTCVPPGLNFKRLVVLAELI